MAIQGLNFTILNSGEAHQSYQATGSFVVYNPNDGVAYVATDRTATGQSWDYKVPSQSGGKFPGPINSYLSIFYLDQTGTGAGGQVVVYASTEAVNIPYFWSIGRALQGQQTSMDIVQGAQPGNPGAGITRLWSDPSGSLNILMPNGTNKVILDSSNAASYVNPLIGQYAFGGDLYGTPSNAHVGVVYNSSIAFHFTNGTFQRSIQAVNNDMYYFAGNSGVLHFYSDTPAVDLGVWNANSNTLTITGSLNVDGYVAVVANNAYIYFTNTTMYIGNPGTGNMVYAAPGGTHTFTTNGSTLANTSCASSIAGTSFQCGSAVLDGTNIQLGGANAYLFFHPNQTVYLHQNYPYLDVGGFSLRCLSVGSGAAVAFSNTVGNAYLCGVGNWAVVGGTNNNGQSFFCAGGAGGPTGWQIISDEKLKSAIVPIADPLSYLLDPTLSGYYYHIAPPKDLVPNEYDSFGFMGQAWKSRAPHMVNEEGDHLMMEPTQVTPVLWEALKEYISKTDLRLAALESGRTASPG